MVQAEHVPDTAGTGAPRHAAQFILDAVGDLSRPKAGLPITNGGLESIPGKLGLWNGITNATSWLKHGKAHVIAQAAGYGGVYKYQFFRYPVVFVSDAELVSEIVRNESRAWSAPLAWRLFFEGLDPSIKFMDSLVTLDHEPHKDARRLMQPAFSAAALASYVELATPIFERTIDTWRARGTVPFKAEVRRLFAKVAGQIFLGVEDDAQAEMLDRCLADYWRAPVALLRNPLGPTWRRARAGYRKLYDWLSAQVLERRKRGGSDLFSRMCQTAPDVQWIDDEALVRLFVGVLAAAFDTTSCAVTSMAYELARNPTWQARLRDEALRVATPPRSATLDDIRKLDEIEWAWRETLRMHPVAADIPRRAVRDISVGGYTIPAGTMVMALLIPAMHDPKIWTEPSRFDPDRFSPACAEDKKVKGAYMPFGAGAHSCIGAQLSTLEAKAFWHAMLSRCRFELAQPYDAHHEVTPLGMVSGDVALRISPV